MKGDGKADGKAGKGKGKEGKGKGPGRPPPSPEAIKARLEAKAAAEATTVPQEGAAVEVTCGVHTGKCGTVIKVAGDRDEVRWRVAIEGGSTIWTGGVKLRAAPPAGGPAPGAAANAAAAKAATAAPAGAAAKAAPGAKPKGGKGIPGADEGAGAGRAKGKGKEATNGATANVANLSTEKEQVAALAMLGHNTAQDAALSAVARNASQRSKLKDDADHPAGVAKSKSSPRGSPRRPGSPRPWSNRGKHGGEEMTSAQKEDGGWSWEKMDVWFDSVDKTMECAEAKLDKLLAAIGIAGTKAQAQHQSHHHTGGAAKIAAQVKTTSARKEDGGWSWEKMGVWCDSVVKTMDCAEAKLDKLLAAKATASSNAQAQHQSHHHTGGMAKIVAQAFVQTHHNHLKPVAPVGGQLNKQLSADGLSKQHDNLKAASTRAPSLVPEDSEICTVAAVYSRNKGDLKQIAKETGANLSLLERHPPKDAADFAHHLLKGDYTEIGGEVCIDAGPPTAFMLQAVQLKAVEKRRTPSMLPQDKDIEVLAKIYDRCSGDLAKLATATGASPALLERAPPANGTDFGNKLLLGVYLDGLQEALGIDLFDPGDDAMVTAEELKAGSVKLKKVAVKEKHGGKAMVKDSDVKVIAKLFTEIGAGDMEKVANAFGADVDLIKNNPPADANDFAHKLLGGFYTGDVDAQSQAAQPAAPWLSQLQGQAGMQNDASEKVEGAKPASNAVEAAKPIVKDGVEAAKEDGASEKVEGAKPASSAVEVAKPIVKDGVEAAKEDAGASRAVKVARAKEELKKALANAAEQQAKEIQLVAERDRLRNKNGHSTSQELKLLCQLYKDNHECPEQFAELVGLPEDWLDRSKPRDAEDWSRKLLKGDYVSEAMTHDVVISRFQKEWREALAGYEGTTSSRQFGSSVRTTGISDRHKEISILAPFCKALGHDPKKIAEVTGSDIQILLKKKAPADPKRMADLLISGFFVGSRGDVARMQLRSSMQAAMEEKQEALERLKTTDEVPEQFLAKLFADARGNFEKLGQVTGASGSLMRATPPEDATDFVEKFCQGLYVREAELQGLDPKKVEMEVMAKLYTSNKGDLAKIADVCGIVKKDEFIEFTPPKDAEDFARKMLEGVWETK